MVKEGLQHILEAQQFSKCWMEEEFFPEVDYINKLFELDVKYPPKFLDKKSVCVLFYEPSTRTRISFEQAAHKLGASVSSTENAKDYSSAVKGESLIDSIRTVDSYYFDAIILRSHYVGGAHDAAKVSSVPIINAGDGAGQHPTQALLDLATIRKLTGKTEGLNIALVGDLKNGRTVRSLTYLLSKFQGNHFSLVAPKGFWMKKDILEYLERHDLPYSQHKKLEDVAGDADVIYMTRLQTERIPYLKKLPLSWQFFLAKIFLNAKDVSINEAVMEKVRDCAIIMHPLPRSEGFNELPERFTDDPRVEIFRSQTKFGLYTRMALLKMILG